LIPLIDIGAQYRELKVELDLAVARIWETSQFILGQEVAAFEEEFAAYCQAGFGVGVNSGTSALHLALLAAGVGPGDEVITVPFTFYATVAAIDYCGATPVYVDIDPRTFNMDPSQIESRITGRTRAILPVHLFGQAAGMDPILAIARKHKLIVVEDAAQAHGAEYRGRRVGAIGDIGCFSFYPTKNLSAAGEGGMAVTNNPEYAHKMRVLRDWGQETKYRPILKGFNYRLPGMQGAILRVKLGRLEAWTEMRRKLAAEYDRLLSNLEIVTPYASPENRHVYCLYTIRTEGRDPLQQALQAAGIGCAVHYPMPAHRLPAYADSRYGEGDFPVSEECCRTVLSLPMYPHLEPGQVHQVCEVVRRNSASRAGLGPPISTAGCPPQPHR
jgi:dTDP-4-amino-4,6-dideoxygalactose transaminase